ADLDSGDRGDADPGGDPEVDVAVAALPPGADDRGREDGEQRRRLRVQLREAEHEHERRHEQDPAAHSEEPGEHAGEAADGDDEDDRHTSSRTPTAASTNANRYVRRSRGIRCWSAVPATTPTTAGMPTSAAAPGFTSPCSAYVTAPATEETRIAASDVAEARRCSKWRSSIRSGTITIPPPTPNSAPNATATKPIRSSFATATLVLYAGGRTRPARRRAAPRRAVPRRR